MNPIKLKADESRLKGFTLIEVLISLSIVAVVFGLIISSSNIVRQKSRDAQRQGDLRGIQSALQQYYTDQNYFPSSAVNSPLNLVTSGAISNKVGRPVNTDPTKNYLPQIPQDSGSTPYCYRGFSDSSSTGVPPTCSNTLGSECHYYVLCARLEGSGTSAPQCTQCGAGYNFQITP
jgi:prepilin-type N-terminal cleavage/methylation domain-containing protein